MSATKIPVGTEVIAIDHRGVEVTGVVETINWCFDKILFYVVREHDNGRVYPNIPSHNIWPSRDSIRPA
jgi:hypothetical protein